MNGQEKALSPVIGVILMVCIVVIIASVIAAFVFGMTSQTDSHMPQIEQNQQKNNFDIGYYDGLNQSYYNPFNYDSYNLGYQTGMIVKHCNCSTGDSKNE